MTFQPTSTALVAVSTALPAMFVAELDKAAGLAREEKAPSTRRAYASDFLTFQAWSAERGLDALPATAEAVAAFLASECDRGMSASTIGRRVAAIRYAHKLGGHPTPTDDERVKATVRGIRRKIGTAPKRKAPCTAERVIPMALGVGDGLKGLRDRALILLGFAGAFRRSEIVALNVEDIEETEAGMRITIRRSKTDQEGAGQTIAIVRGSIACPVAALKAWLQAAGISEGHLFRSVRKGGKAIGAGLSAQAVANVVKAQARAVGLESTQYAAHSLRAGFCTSAASKGASLFKLMDVTRHKSVDTLRSYVRDADLFANHAGAGLL